MTVDRVLRSQRGNRGCVAGVGGPSKEPSRIACPGRPAFVAV